MVPDTFMKKYFTFWSLLVTVQSIVNTSIKTSDGATLLLRNELDWRNLVHALA